MDKTPNTIILSSTLSIKRLDETVYVYVLRCPITNSIGYVGMSTCPQHRMTKHCSITQQRKINSRLSQWLVNILIQKQKPIMVIIEALPNHINVWELRENFWIKFYRLCGFELTNTQSGGRGIPQYNQSGTMLYQQRKKQSRGKRLVPTSETTKQKISKANKGKKRSQEQRQQMSVSQTGKKRPSSEKAVYQHDLDLNIISTYRSMTCASESTGILKTSIVNCLQGRAKTAGGFKWSYVNKKIKT